MRTLPVSIAVAVWLSFAGGAHAQQQGMSDSSNVPDSAVQTESIGSESSAHVQSGMPMGLTRAQVIQDLRRAKASGELDRINQLYQGN